MKQRTEKYMNEVLTRLNKLSEPFDVVFKRGPDSSDIFITTIMRGLYESFSIREIEAIGSDAELKFAIQYRIQRSIAETLAFLVEKNVDILLPKKMSTYFQ